MVLLHGAGDLEALGVPLPLLLLVAAGAIPAVAGALSARAVGMAGRPAPRHRAFPRPVRAAADAPPTRAIVRALGVAALVVVIAVAALGPDSMTGNAAPRLALVVVWGGVAVASLLLGPVWRAASPFRALAAAVRRLTDPDGLATRPLPARLGLWPAAAGIGAWAWLAEAYPTPRAVALLLIAYAAVQVAAGVRYGDAWFPKGESLEALSGLLGSAAPIGRDGDGRLGVRDPVPSLAGLAPEPGTRALIAVTLAWELSHAVRGTEQWPALASGVGLRPGALAATLALLASALVCALAVRAATPRPFLVAATVPLLAGWTLSHHVGPAVMDWRAALADLADPFGWGWSLHEVTGPPLEPAAPGAVAAAQLLLLVAGALFAVVAAHRMAVARYDLRAARAVQFPLRALLVAAVLTGVGLQAAAAA